jgi:PLP dependent protein
MGIRENIEQVRERMDAACRRVGRRVDEVKLIAVSKTVQAERIREAYEAGLREFGENRVQEAAAKQPALADVDITWHLIGHLQSNKAKLARELFHWIQSVDSVHLARRLDQTVAGRARPLRVLLQVNLGGEESKSGVRETDIAGFAAEVSQLRSLEIEGLMAVPPFCENPQDARPYFRRLRQLAGELAALTAPKVTELSMGMSHDFEAAIEEGATMIRVGTAIFGAR